MFVIARNSSFTYKGRAVDVKQVGRELGVRYVLQGSIRKAANQVRIAAQLIDSATGKHLWADRFDAALNDIFDMQDQVTISVVGAIAPKLEQAEIERATLKQTGSLDAYDLYLRGLASIHQGTRETNREALRLFYLAVELDPDFAPAHGMAAWCYAWRKLNGWAGDAEAEVTEATRLARRATRLGKNDAVALAMGGYALASVAGEFEDAGALADRALALNPNLASAWLLSGLVKISVGESEAAIEHIETAIRLSPFDSFSFIAYSLIGLCHFRAGRYDEASAWAERSVREQPDWLPALRRVAASHAVAGRMEPANKAVGRLLQIDPTMRVSALRMTMNRLLHPDDVAKLMEGLRRAGLPE
jgi:tetratricopeptide (TPR) repeat protein